ncbi:MAG TPA: hypothetical protein VJR29_08900 [bacterium]|nr:hypothetical protein [bacterium]
MGQGTSVFFRVVLTMILALGLSSQVYGKAKAAPPDQKGPYNVGIRTIDNVPMSGGRLARVQLFYPTSAPADCDTKYTIIGVGGSFERSSPLCAVQNAAPAAGLFPLVVYNHGGNAAGVDAQRIAQMPLQELMASHGFIVIVQRHSANNVARVVDTSLLLDFALSAGNPVAASIDSERIGLSGFSAGGRAALAATSGWAAQGIAADPRFKAMVLYEPSRDNTLEEIASLAIPYLIMGGTRMVSGIVTMPEIFETTVNASPRILVQTPNALHFSYQSDLCLAIEETREAALALDPNQVEPLVNMITPTTPNCLIDPTTGACVRACNSAAMSAPAIQACTYWNQGELFSVLVARAFGGGRNICDKVGTSPDSNRSLDTDPADGLTDEFLGGDPLIALFEGNDVWNSDASHDEPPPNYDTMQPVLENYTIGFFKKFLEGEGSYMKYLTPGYAQVHDLPANVDIRE